MQGKKWRTPERERHVIELYLQFHSVPKVAKMVDCGATTIQNILNDNGIKQDGRRGRRKKPNKVRAEPKVRKSNCRSKYCPALIVMLHNALGWNAKQIAEVTGYVENSARSVLSKRGAIPAKRRVSKDDLDLDQIEHEYLSGTSSSILADKYGVNPGTISKWMRDRGICLGKGAHQEGRNGQDMIERHEQAEREFAERVAAETDGHFEYAGKFRIDGDRGADIRCTVCGYTYHRFELSRLNLIRCPTCAAKETRIRQEQERDARRYERMFSELREFVVAKTCAYCGGTFQSSNPSAKYCSKGCSRKAHDTSSNFRHYYHVKYGDAYRKHYDPSVTLNALYERDGGICQICGEPCDWDDKEWGCMGPTYPSIDHIIPRAKGGDHFWSNVQLAHCMCNSRKRDLPDDAIKAEVMLNAS